MSRIYMMGEEVVEAVHEGGEQVYGKNLAVGTSSEFKIVNVNAYTGNLVSAGVTSKLEYSLKDLGVQTGDTIIISLYVGKSEEGFGGNIRIDDTLNKILLNNSRNPVINDYAVVPFIIPDGITGLKFYLTQHYPNSYYDVPTKEFKIERGTKATSWSPAPEDLIDSLKPQTYPLAII